MELTLRQKAILAEIVKLHIAGGEPIGSKLLCEVLSDAPSSATLRNEMSTLCLLGLLEQPHTSAGRIPTAAGYKMYIESLMNENKASEEIRRYIDEALESAESDPEKLPEYAGKALNNITGLPVLAADISLHGPKIKRVELLPLGSNVAMMVLITSDGKTRSRLCHSDKPISRHIIHSFNSVAEKKVLGRFTSDLSPAYMQNAILEYGIESFTLMPLFSALNSMIKDIEQSAVSIVGQSTLFGSSFETREAEKIISLINKRETLMSLFNGDNLTGVVFGGETQFSALKPSSIVFAKYNAGNNSQGCIGVIGPMRMSYEQIIPSIEYTAKRMNELLSNALCSMEE
ncbi:MAG: heat-inducible transcription repressor HrcA [Clostridiales bacterium]|nr:heat-inducible transcription repressor HrcA [Candidatus Equinaster intestinalis]